MGQKVAGTAYVKADGEQFEITGGAEAPLMDVKRESILPGYFKEEDLVPYIKMDAVFTRNFPIKKLKDATSMTVTFELKSGRIYVLTEAYVVGEPAVSADDAKVSIEFNGTKGLWQ